MTRQRFTSFGFVLAVLLLAASAVADPAAQYLHALRGLGKPVLSARQVPDAQQNPSAFAGQVFALTVTVSGVVSSGGERTALLSLGETSLAARLPETLRTASWLDSGCSARVLVRVDETGNETSLSQLSVLAAAPESDVAQAERALLARQAASTRRLRSYPSRSMTSYRGGRVALEPITNPGVPIAPLSPQAARIYPYYRSAIRRLNRSLSEYDVDKITTSVLYFSDRDQIDPRLIVAMIIAESDFDIHSTSNHGAMGLGQLMPETARGLGVTDAYDPIQNIAASVHILRGHLDQYGGAPPSAGVIPFNQIALTMAAYNAGPGAVRKYHGIPPYRETQRYVAKVAALYKQMCGG